MDTKDKAFTLTELVKIRLDKYNHTRDLEFRVNIALWTLIVLVGYRGGQIIDLGALTDFLFYGAAALAVVLGHYFFWLIPMSASMARDNARILELQRQVENIVGENHDNPERGQDDIKKSYRTMNLFLAGITMILLILLGIYLAL
jgi:hypothetical protein